MMKKDIIKRIIRDFHLGERFDVKKRNIRLPIDSGKIVTVIGVRRSGKTSLLYDTVNRLCESVEKTNIVYINFEDERLELKAEELDLIIQGYGELYPQHDLKDCYLFFDEIQNVAGWEKFVRRVYDTLTKHIFITGSNAKFLSSEIATSLRGRTLSFEVFPLSFQEYLDFQEIPVDFYSSRSLGYIKHTLERFLKEGAFPEILFLDKVYHRQTLQEYLNVMLYRDLIERYGITNTVALKFFIKRLIASSTKQLSINKIYNELKSSGIKIGKNTLYDFLDYVQSIYLALPLYRYDDKIVNKELGEKKIYTIDTGLTGAVVFSSSDNLGKALENAVFLEIRRKETAFFYFRNDSAECDFVLTQHNKIVRAIQVCYDMSDPETRKREIKGLLAACKAFGLQDGTVVTYDEETTIEQNGIVIDVIPFYKWALTEE